MNMITFFWIIFIAGIVLIGVGIIFSLMDDFCTNLVWGGLLTCGCFLLCVSFAIGLILK